MQAFERIATLLLLTAVAAWTALCFGAAFGLLPSADRTSRVAPVAAQADASHAAPIVLPRVEIVASSPKRVAAQPPPLVR